MPARAVFILVFAAFFGTAALAAGDDPDRLLADGVARFQRGDYPGAARALEQARALQPDDEDAGLLLGITYYRLHRADDARPLLEAAAASADAETAASARLFLALMALDREDAAPARAWLAQVAASPLPDLAGTARDLLAQTRGAPLTVFVLVRPEYDSNVPLLPAAATTRADQGDVDLMLFASLRWRPVERVPFYVDAAASYRKQGTLTAYDLLTGGATLRYDDGSLELAGGGEVVTLGGATLLGGVGAAAGYHLHLRDDLVPWAGYSIRYRGYDLADYAGYTGVTHGLGGGVGFGRPTATLRGEVGYLFTREGAGDPTLAASAHGVQVGGHARLGRWGATLNFAGTRRGFDSGRGDWQAALDGSVELAVTPVFGLLGGASVLRNVSSDAGFDYLKATIFAGAYLGISL